AGEPRAFRGQVAVAHDRAPILLQKRCVRICEIAKKCVVKIARQFRCSPAHIGAHQENRMGSMPTGSRSGTAQSLVACRTNEQTNRVRLRLCLPLVPAYDREIVVCKRAREFGYETVWLIRDSASS